MKKLFCGLVSAFVALAAVSSVNAQTVGTIGVGDITYSATGTELRPKENVISAISGGINSALLKTRKFTVLDYAQLEARLVKQDLNLSGFYNKTYTGTEYLQAGLDYILTADITEFGLYKQARGKSERTTGLVDVDFKLIGVADVTADITSSVSAQSSAKIAVDNTDASQEILDKAIQQAVDQMVDQIISELFPIRVMVIAENGSVTLNYGEGLLAAGDTVLVYPKDAEIVIDETGEVVGEAVATLQVISTERKFATAQALSGFEALEKGQKGKLILASGG